MSKKNLVICDCEYPYVNYLMENILEKKEPTLCVYVCTSWDKVTELMQSRPIHILLLDESYLYVPDEGLEQIERIVILAHTKGKEQLRDWQVVYKYQHIDRILSEIFEDVGIFQSTRTNGQRVFAVYSPIGRCGKTSFAVALGKELAKKGKTLYLNLDTYPGNEIFQREEGLPNLGDMLYYFKQEHTNPGLRLTAMVQQEERLDFLMPIPLAADLKEVTPEDWKDFLVRLEEDSQYDNLILDIGEGVQGIFEILDRCDKIYMPVVRDECSERKLASYEKNLFLMNFGHLERKTIKIVIPENVSLDISTILMRES